MSLYEEINNLYSNDEFRFIIRSAKLEILNGYNENTNLVKRYFEHFYSNKYPDIVLCGINPGRNGAGKTGIPFLDFNSLSKIFKNVDRYDRERSSTFLYKVIEYFGIEKFFNNFLLTNYSFLGFVQNKKNFNYYDLPDDALRFIEKTFKYELKIIRPKYIISLSKEVHKSINFIEFDFSVNTDHYLPHPYYCSFTSRENNYLQKYKNLLSELIKEVNTTKPH